MEGAALPGRLIWRAARVREIIDETPRVRTLMLDCPDWPGHLAGQHVDVRLTAEDGYQAERSYSIASAPGDEVLALTVERIDDGEVSPYLVGELRVGDEMELRGPIGGYFVWSKMRGGPLLLLAGGSGIVPLRCIMRQHAAVMSDTPVRLLYSVRSQREIIYRTELDQLAGNGVEVIYTLTREWPDDWTGYRRRIDADLLREIAWPAAQRPLAYVCGPTAFVERAASELVSLQYEPDRIKTERFGPTNDSSAVDRAARANESPIT
jgi:ferredoxin-NADP reductase